MKNFVCDDDIVDKLYDLGYECGNNFSTDYLISKLPACIDTKQNEPFNYYWLHIQKRAAENIQYIINYHCDTYEPPLFGERKLVHPNIHDNNFANALAKMLIHLRENNLI